MSFQHLNLKLVTLAVGLIVILILASLLSANEKVKAAPSTVDCVKSLSTQAPTCAGGTNAIRTASSTVTAWFLPLHKEPEGGSSAIISSSTDKKVAQESRLPAGGFALEALILFGAAFAGIVFLGRRRK
ncbi:hypothetical protein [Sneathiella litorea]|uniref:LPXTG cell wall anchor domain-containing protein n=1 Tax=Sneathiella litorea TaxID=2606216 RepID=A0A6L8W6Z3_9PROT|nr:hypothetical protein [Sneathiella litorea]MZR30886.1 hypothetical protein [Sneathiella litorea]